MKKKYIASCSFGKDSLAMIIKIKELGLPLDEVFYVDIRFDDTPYSGEMPLMREFIPKAKRILKEKFNVDVVEVKSKITFVEQFYKVKQRGNHIGDNYGFPYTIGAWCNSRLKLEPINDYLKRYKDYEVIQYIGIAYDEPKRYERLKDDPGKICPLVDLKITEDEAIEICKKYDLLSPIYDTSFRGGCWFCVKQSLPQLRNLYKTYPDLWNKLREMEKDSHNTFRPNTTLAQLEERFKKEIDKDNK